MAAKNKEWKITDSGPKSGNAVRAELHIGGVHFADLLDPRADEEFGDKCPITNKQFAEYAQMIEAAPQMLVALKLVLPLLSTHGNAAKKVRAAIEAATTDAR